MNVTSVAEQGTQSEHWSTRARAVLHRIGLNVVTTVAGADHAALLPGCRSIVVFASGGTALWDALLSDLKEHPEHLRESDHPLDDFIERQIALADPSADASRRWIRCAARPEAFIDFRPLAARGSMGWRSRLGLLLNPIYGPWIALRAACLTTELLQPDAPLRDASPCETCAAPCIGACPGNALSSGAMNIRRCSEFHLESDRCRIRCDARLACPEGAQYRYSPLQQQYHYSRRIGRYQVARLLGISDDTRLGRDPRWVEWSRQ